VSGKGKGDKDFAEKMEAIACGMSNPCAYRYCAMIA
jgi:hypothetical protein